MGRWAHNFPKGCLNLLNVSQQMVQEYELQCIPGGVINYVCKNVCNLFATVCVLSCHFEFGKHYVYRLPSTDRNNNGSTLCLRILLRDESLKAKCRIIPRTGHLIKFFLPIKRRLCCITLTCFINYILFSENSIQKGKGNLKMPHLFQVALMKSDRNPFK